MIKTQKQFAEVVGETHTNVRNIIGRQRGPRQFTPGGATDQAERQCFGVADALAWRIVKKLTHLGMTWDEAADVVRRERCADLALRDGVNEEDFFAIWDFLHPHLFKAGAYRGRPSKISEIVEYDIANFGMVANLRMVSLRMAYIEAEDLAEQAGYVFEGDDIVPLEDGA